MKKTLLHTFSGTNNIKMKGQLSPNKPEKSLNKIK